MRKYLFFTVFISGITSLAVEMAASRLLGNVFGTSNLVWASIIGLILIYLAVGNFVGGRWADRSPHYSTFYKILLWGAFLIAVVPLISRPVLRLAANAFDQLSVGILAGSFLAVIILLAVPITLLGTASPFAIRLAIQETQASGRVSGRIYAISTLGSFFGTFLPVLVFIPLLGTPRTFLAISFMLICAALPGLFMAVGWKRALPFVLMPLMVIGLFFWGVRGGEKNSPGQIYETESQYNYIQVLERDGYHLLRLNEGQGVHSMYKADDLFYYGPWEQVLAAPFFNPAPFKMDDLKSMAIVGLAAGTTARQATAVFGEDVQIDGIEIDARIVEVGRKYFDMNQPNLNVIVQDGRWALENSEKRYQVISVDAYRPPYIPPHLTTLEFFQSVHDHLTDDGVMVINIGRSPTDRRLINSLASTIGEVFPSIYVVDVPNTFNSILYATVQETNQMNLIENYQIAVAEDAHPLLMYAMQVAIAQMQPDPPPAQVFTDDLAPIEWITNDMILDYLTTGEGEVMQ